MGNCYVKLPVKFVKDLTVFFYDEYVNGCD